MSDNSDGVTSLVIQGNEWRKEVVSLARELERLPAGDYNIRLVKPDITGVPWRVEIARVDRVRLMELWR